MKRTTLALGLVSLVLTGCSWREEWGCTLEGEFSLQEVRLMALCPKAALIAMWSASEAGQGIYSSWRVGKEYDMFYISYRDPRYVDPCTKHLPPNYYC